MSCAGGESKSTWHGIALQLDEPVWSAPKSPAAAFLDQARTRSSAVTIVRAKPATPTQNTGRRLRGVPSWFERSELWQRQWKDTLTTTFVADAAHPYTFPDEPPTPSAFEHGCESVASDEDSASVPRFSRLGTQESVRLTAVPELRTAFVR
jgi:hypothetical protein